MQSCDILLSEMSGSQQKMTSYTKKYDSVTHTQKKKQSVETVSFPDFESSRKSFQSSYCKYIKNKSCLKK